MAMDTCKLCMSLYNRKFDQKGRICPDCRKRLDDLYIKVRDYIRENHKEDFDVEQVSKDLDVDLRDVETLVELGYLDRDVDGGRSFGVDKSRQKLLDELKSSMDLLKDNAAAEARRKHFSSYGQEVYSKR